MESSALQFSSAATLHPGALPLLFSRCSTARDAEQIHALLLTTGLHRHRGTLLSLCSSTPPSLLPLSRLILSLRRLPDPFLWNSLLMSSSHGPFPLLALPTFSSMLSSPSLPDRFSLSLALTACARAVALPEGSQIHALLFKLRLSSDLFLLNCLIVFYSRCGCVDAARQAFDGMPERDAVSWNSMIDGYAKSGRMETARRLFDQIPKWLRGLKTYNSMINGYSRLGCAGIVAAREMFDGMEEKDAVTWNSMIDGYAKCGMVDEALDLFGQMPFRDLIAWGNIIFVFTEAGSVDMARCVFDAMPDKDVVAWNIMMSGYIKNGCFVEALSLFHEMQLLGDLVPDVATLTIVLSCITELGFSEEGISVHDYIVKNQLPLDGKIGVALIDMYAKCGQLLKAFSIFESSGCSTIDHWNAMIGGLAIHGLGHVALRFFAEMSRLRLRPDDITFIGILSACSHSGLVKEGFACFMAMKRVHKIQPKIQHYGCMVDMLCRAGRLEEARILVEDMPMKPNTVIFRSLLSACRNHGNIDIGQTVSKHLVEVDPLSSSSYILLSNIYAGLRMWEDARNVRAIMKAHYIRKIPGCSWIQIDGAVHKFMVGEGIHPQVKDMYSLLNGT